MVLENGEEPVRSTAVVVGESRNLTVQEVRLSGVLGVDVNGRVDGGNSEALLRVLEDMLRSDDLKVVLDFDDLSYISSAGLRVVMIMSRRLAKREGGRFAACGVRGVVREVFEVSGFNKIVPLYPGFEEAVESLNAVLVLDEEEEE